MDTRNFNYHHFDLKSHRPNVLKRVVEPSLLDTYCYAALAILKHRPRETSVIETYLEMCESSFTNVWRNEKKADILVASIPKIAMSRLV